MLPDGFDGNELAVKLRVSSSPLFIIIKPSSLSAINSDTLP